MPGATCAVLVTFCPRALGEHNAVLEVEVLAQHNSMVASTTRIEVHGRSDRLGPYVAPAGGVAALPESFVKPRKYVDQDQARRYAALPATSSIRLCQATAAQSLPRPRVRQGLLTLGLWKPQSQSSCSWSRS